MTSARRVPEPESEPRTEPVYPTHIDHGFVESQGQRLYTAAAGPVDGPLVILLHGFPEFSYAWRHLLGPLALLGLRALAVDQRGYGKSSKPRGRAAYAADVLAQDVLALADANGAERFDLVGHDWGGIVAWHVATRFPERVKRLTVLNAPHPATLLESVLGSPAQALRSSYIALFQLPWLPEAVLGAADSALLERALVSTSREGSFSSEELAIYHQAWAEPGALTSMLNWYRAMPLAPSLRGQRVTVPVQILWGDRDSALGPDLAEQAEAQCEQVQVTHFAQATHWLHHEEPARVAREVTRFFGLA